MACSFLNAYSELINFIAIKHNKVGNNINFHFTKGLSDLLEVTVLKRDPDRYP